MQNTVLFLWRSSSKFHPISLLSKQQHPWFRDWLRIILSIPATLWGRKPRSWCMQLLGGLGLWSVRWLRMQVMITGKLLSKVSWMWTARVCDDLEEKVVQGSSFDYLTENWRIKQTKKLIQVSMFGRREVWHFMVKFRTWLTVDSPLSFEGLQSMFLDSLTQQFHSCISQNIWDERVPFSFKWNLFGTTAINTNFSAPTHCGSWTLRQNFSVHSSQWYSLYQSKLYQIVYISSDLCSFCTRASESLYHLCYFCPFSK